jgi:hypothetical protein
MAGFAAVDKGGVDFGCDQREAIAKERNGSSAPARAKNRWTALPGEQG